MANVANDLWNRCYDDYKTHTNQEKAIHSNREEILQYLFDCKLLQDEDKKRLQSKISNISSEDEIGRDTTSPKRIRAGPEENSDNYHDQQEPFSTTNEEHSSLKNEFDTVVRTPEGDQAQSIQRVRAEISSSTPSSSAVDAEQGLEQETLHDLDVLLTQASTVIPLSGIFEGDTSLPRDPGSEQPLRPDDHVFQEQKSNEAANLPPKMQETDRGEPSAERRSDVQPHSSQSESCSPASTSACSSHVLI